MADVAIKVSGLTKRFRIYHNNIMGPIKDALRFWRRMPSPGDYYDELIAVEEISLEVRKGEVVGLVGPNGAGKTTLLQLIAGILQPDEGAVEVQGRLTTLLAHGTVVHPEASGRENIYDNGLMLGMTPDEIEAKTPWLIEFSELGEAIDRPFRTYSSGMQARLLVSIALSIDPDVLLVDEALSTGDSRFVEKCRNRVREICEKGATILFVSHNLTHIQEICGRAFFMLEGRLTEEGTPSAIVAAYNAWAFGEESKAPVILRKQGLQLVGGTGEVLLKAVRVKNGEGIETTGFYTGDCMHIEADYTSTLAAGTKIKLFIGIVKATDGTWIGELGRTYVDEGPDNPMIKISDGGTIHCVLDPLLLLNNHYELWIMMFSDGNCVCEYRGVAPFFVAKHDYVIERGSFFWHPFRVEVYAD